jgi:glycosyltransferase involved in cell wall biosynthesis
MRVLAVLEQGVPSGYLGEAFRALVDRGIDLHLVTLGRRGPMHEHVERLGATSVALGLDRRTPQALAPLLLAREIRGRRPALVHAHEALPAALAAAGTRLARSSAAVAYHRHHGVTRPPHAAISRFAARQADVTIAVSAYVADCAARLDGVGPERVTVATNGVPAPRRADEAEVAALRRSLGVPPDAATLTVVARLRPEKGHTWLLDALPTVRRSAGRPVHCVVVGDGPERGRLEARDVTPDAPVHFVGAQADVGPWYQVGDVVVVPSLHEPFGLVAIEAMALGRPLVASAEGGLSEIVVHGQTGLSVPPGDTGALVGAVAELLRDQPAAAVLGAAGRDRWQAAFTTDHMVDAWLAAFDRAVTRRAAHRRGS